jgi:leukotriene-A4 hydrolase
MFSQCQAIHARSVLPCQDTPDVKAPVLYKIRSPLQVLASGSPVEDSGVDSKLKGYTFKQNIPIPSYLIAIASGDLKSASIGPRSTVWTGPEELEGCKWELSGDMEKYMEAAESIIFPYVWGSYNVLVLPSSFP